MKLLHSKNINNLDVIATSLFTLLAIYQNQVTVFYILYLFWWNEVLYAVVTFYYKKRNGFSTNFSSKFFLIGIYFIFIVVFFGLIAHHKNYDIVAFNFEVLFFKNVFFNLNLILFLGEMIWFYKSNSSAIEKATAHPFSARAIILHVSIILGVFIMMLVVPKFPEFFKPENNWSSIAIIFPFIVLRYFFHRNGFI